MTRQISSSQAFRSRSRKWTTAACLSAAVLGAGALAGHHYLYGALCLLASTVLFNGSSLARKHRASSVSTTSAPTALPRRRPLSKAA
jgi:hypothetical protein